MADSKKKAESKTAPIMDVARPGKSKPSSTSKPVIVTNRPILQDPMVVEDKPDETGGKPVVKSGKITITPLDDLPAAEKKTIAELAVEAAADKEEPATEEKSEPELPAPPEEEKPAEPAEEAPAEDKPDEEKPAEDAPDKKNPADPAVEEAAKAEELAKHETKIQELADSKKYYLPINSVEKRRSKRVVMAGVVLSLVLALAWVDVALDAGLIELGSVKPVTHFFSN